MKFKRVLFLCTGNYYRSRFAEILFNHWASERNVNWRADSRGLRISGCNLGPISEFTIEQLKRLGIPLEAPHRLPLPLTVEDLEAADHVVAVKHAEHYRMVAADFPAWLEKVEFWAIDDIDCAVPDEAIPLLIAEVIKLANRLTEAPLANLSEPRDQEPYRESPSP